jgi:hypothetical protein
MMLSESSNGMTMNTDVARIGYQFQAEHRNLPSGAEENHEKILLSTFSVQSKIRNGHLTIESHHVSKHKRVVCMGSLKCAEVGSTSCRLNSSSTTRLLILTFLFIMRGRTDRVLVTSKSHRTKTG